MKVTVIGTGYVGLVTGACLSEMGNHVVCLDVDPAKIKILNDGGIPIHEPGLLEVVRRNVAAGRLEFTTDIERSVAHGTIQFIAVGTPPDEDGSADLQYVTAAARNIGRSRRLGGGKVTTASSIPERMNCVMAVNVDAESQRMQNGIPLCSKLATSHAPG